MSRHLSGCLQLQLPNSFCASDARALFERTVALVEPEKAKPVWDRMAQYEYQYGDYLAAQKIFQRYSEAFPDGQLPSTDI